MKELKISTGIIRNAAGEVFITQRAADGHMANKWEFPGGKIEEGESPEMAHHSVVLAGRQLAGRTVWQRGTAREMGCPARA